MPNTRSAAKRVRSSQARRLYNRSIKSRVRTLVKKFEQAVQSGEKELAVERYRAAASALDKAAAKGVVHKNLAARKKSRMATKLASLA
ncbi:MAG: 30S ribosomal protein S20 [Clostridia bacterium]|nr:30S ribosomal protein S20 [Bacillota bacterium]MBO2520610.1 30S ribosomal protein S20 [Bacillota bacterium]